jgi:hypothetical protein
LPIITGKRNLEDMVIWSSSKQQYGRFCPSAALPENHDAMSLEAATG